MWITNYLTCLARGHAFSPLTHNNSAFEYCLHCGKVESQVPNMGGLTYKELGAALRVPNDAISGQGHPGIRDSGYRQS